LLYKARTKIPNFMVPVPSLYHASHMYCATLRNKQASFVLPVPMIVQGVSKATRVNRVRRVTSVQASGGGRRVDTIF
jgi:hypothetical protein